ncbi:MAG: ribonuclease R [Deltaproteobacteria bacterium]|nr:ribonuclease R [Deltaproteobacteria bacterium]MCL5278271.1 ribonuclease R [Deltaproteobacteria bacterium]
MKMIRKRNRGFRKQGTMFVHPDGYGFVSTDLPKDIFIPPKRMNGAMHGDLVMVDANTRDGKLYEGRVLKILQRTMKYVTGTVVREHGQLSCSPLDRHITFDLPFERGAKGLKDLKIGDVVRCEMITDVKGNNMARLHDRLGDRHTPDIDVKLIIAKHNLPYSFSNRTSSYASSIPHTISETERAKRHDLTGMPIVTIDGETARDFDDAVFVRKADHGYTLYVSIADVSHYVRMDDPVDAEAYTRGTSVYFPDRAIPMLPEVLSNDLCSLKPDEERLTITAEIRFDRNGKRLNYTVYPSIIKSSARLTYTMVRDMIEHRHLSISTGPAEHTRQHLLANLQVMNELALMLREHRMKNGSLDFDLPDIELTVDQYGDPQSVTRIERNIAHVIVEEFMLEANKVVAAYCTSTSHPFIYRIHEPPDRDKLYEFYLFMHNLGLKIPPFDSMDSLSIQIILDKVKDSNIEKVINYTLLRSMKQAKYSVENIGHYGLAFDLYTHFTSPIRRYPDLTVHRILKDLFARNMSKKRAEMWAPKLEDIAKHSSETERKAMDAERDLNKILIAKMLADKQDSPVLGYISGITGSGMFIEIEDFFIDGFLAFEDIPGDYYYSDTNRHVAIGKRTHRTFKIGQKVNVEIASIGRFTGEIKLGLARKK